LNGFAGTSSATGTWELLSIPLNGFASYSALRLPRSPVPAFNSIEWILTLTPEASTAWSAFSLSIPLNGFGDIGGLKSLAELLKLSIPLNGFLPSYSET